MVGACCTHVESKIFVLFWWKTSMEREHLEEKGIDEEIILKRIVNG
jgi:hypothetical protein